MIPIPAEFSSCKAQSLSSVRELAIQRFRTGFSGGSSPCSVLRTCLARLRREYLVALWQEWTCDEFWDVDQTQNLKVNQQKRTCAQARNLATSHVSLHHILFGVMIEATLPCLCNCQKKLECKAAVEIKHVKYETC